MKLLAIDSSAKSASAAVFSENKLLSECFVNVQLTHSCTLLPMIDNALKQAALEISDIDCFAVNSGPGSFTGIRIGVSVIKGLAFRENKPCSGVSTLESMAYNFTDENCIVCCTMDARCSQVYCALFRIKDGKVERLTEDDALSIEELGSKISSFSEKIYLAGDGASLCFNSFGKNNPYIVLPAENRLYQRAYGTGLCALERNLFTDSSQLVPSYLRPPQAERELKNKKQREEAT